ncbi:HNH endonuclease [Haloglycomyces albus]|uniref:HNH endonuclease n=1 Tax=Haloglycomyces albus TaxID=526067 RepID=UPI0004B91AFC|nr:HNH endonuclease [Haloglycomyces albus]
MMRPRHRTTTHLSSSLVLNQSYEPLCIVSVRRAAVLLLTNKAVTVTPGDGYLHSESFDLPVPSVVRLKRYVHVPHQMSASPSRRGVFIRDGWTCVYCGYGAETLDHVIPRSRGGTHSWDNVVAACAHCNQRKGDRLLSEIGWRLTRTPKAPSRWQIQGLRLGRTTDPNWEPWLSLVR